MTSRLTAYAACFAVLSAFTITFAASAASHPEIATATRAPALSAAAPAVVEWPVVLVVGRRSARSGG
jgi:hypothetical protein